MENSRQGRIGRLRKAAGTLLLALLAGGGPAFASGPRTVVVLLFDGLAADLVEEADLPNLRRLQREGAWTPRLEPVFPSLSLPNQTSLSTGCLPWRHGIVSNHFLDPEKGEFRRDPDADWLTGCEPIHVTTERQGVRTAALGWVGARSTRRGALASIVSDATVEGGDEGRVAEVEGWLRRPEGERPRLLLAYFAEPDDIQHATGTGSRRTRAAVAVVDTILGRVVAAIEALPAEERERVTLVVTTDHGMRPVQYGINLPRILRRHDIPARFRSSGAVAFLYLSDPRELERALRVLSGYRQFRVGRKAHAAAGARLGLGPRVGDLILTALPPYSMMDPTQGSAWVRWLGSFGPEFLWSGLSLRAAHGYPADTPGMAGIQVFWGAGVARGREVPKARPIDLHPTLAHLLGVAPATPIDGEVAADFLSEPPARQEGSAPDDAGWPWSFPPS